MREQDATMQGTPPVQCFNWSPCTVALLPTHLGSDLLQERVAFTPVVLRHRLHCLPDLLHPGNHIACNISGALTLSTAGTHGHGKRMQGERRGGTMKVRVQMRNGRECGSASTPLKNKMNGRSVINVFTSLLSGNS